MTVEEYRAHPALNFSRLKWLLRSALHFRKQGALAIEETLAIRMGNAVDQYILSGQVAPYAVMPAEIEQMTGKGSRTAKQAWKAQQEALGVTTYKQEEWEKTSAMQQALEANPEFRALLEICPQRQLPVFAKYRGVELKALLDLAGHDGRRRAFGDLKTSVSAAPWDFAKKAANMHYDLQMATYGTVLSLSEGLEEPPAMFWTVVESSPAAPVCSFQVPAAAMESGQRKLDRCIDLYLQCTESGEWPGFGSGFLKLPWPAWEKGEAREVSGVEPEDSESD